MFVRTTGCNLRCWYCDTPYTSWQPEGVQWPWKSVIDEIQALAVSRLVESRAEQVNCRHVVITGGEPLLQSDIVPLSAELQRAGFFVTVETAGTVYRPVIADLSNSVPKDQAHWRRRHLRDQHRPDVIHRFLAEYDCQLKFVIDTPADLDEVATYLQEFPAVTAEQVWLMPQGIDRETLEEKVAWLPSAAAQLGYRYCPRRQIELYGNARRT